MHAKAEIDRLKQTGALGRHKYLRITMPPGDCIAGGFADLIQTEDPPRHAGTRSAGAGHGRAHLWRPCQSSIGTLSIASRRD